MNPQHPLYYHCQHDPSYERYGLLEQKTNSFYIIDSDPELLKKVQLIALKYEFLHFVNIDHYFTFLNKTKKTLDKYQIKSMTQAHFGHVMNAAVYLNNTARIENIQKTLNNDNCFLFGMTLYTARSIPMDVNHYRLIDNIIKHETKDKIFNNELQEKLFLIRRLVYILKGVFEYALEFVTLQEKICDFGFDEYKKHMNICHPEDTIIPRIVEEQKSTEQIRIRSIQQLYNTIYKRLNETNFDQSIKEILEDFSSRMWEEGCITEAEKNYPLFQTTYDIKKIRGIIKSELITLLKYYEQ
jgi:hypothetical protein